MASSRPLSSTLSIILLLCTFLCSSDAIELSEAEQLALESSRELLAPPDLTIRIRSDLTSIRSQIPALANVFHSPKWVPGELSVIDEKRQYVDQILGSSFKPYVIWGSRGNTYTLTYSSPYNPKVLAELLKKELNISGIKPHEPSETGATTSIVVTVPPAAQRQGGNFKYLFLKGRGDCGGDESCDYKKFWLVSVDGSGSRGGLAETLFSSWGSSPDVTEGEQIALESGALLPPPKLVQKIENDLITIKSQFPELRSWRHIPPWTPGELLLVDYDSRYLAKLHSSSFGPVVEAATAIPYPVSKFGNESSSTEDPKRQLLILRFSKPYNPAVLMERLRLEIGELPATLNNRLRQDESAITVDFEAASGKSIYEFKRNWSKCPAGACTSYKFIVDAAGGVDLEEEKKKEEEEGGGG